MYFTALKWGVRRMNCSALYSSRREVSMVSKGFIARLQRELDDYAEGQRIKMAAPDWLPFRPGSSFWMPDMPHQQQYVLQTQTVQMQGVVHEEEDDDDDDDDEEEKGDDEEEGVTEDAQVVCQLVLLDTSPPSDSESES